MLAPHPTRLVLAIVLLSWALFAPTVGNGFAMDDAPLAQSVDSSGRPDEIIATWHAPWWYFGQRYWAGVDNTSVLYRPVTVLSFALTWHAVARWLPAAAEAAPHHLLNVLLHGLCVLLVWGLARDLGVASFGALCAAAVFAVNAIHSEVVASIVGRAELLSFGFGLSATLLFARGRRGGAALLFFAAFCSKESGLAWAPFLPCYLLARGWRAPASARAADVLRGHGRDLAFVLGASLAAYLVCRWIAVHDVGAGAAFAYEQNPLSHAGAGMRVLTAVRLLGYGLFLCCAPFWLYCLYGPGAVTIVDTPLDAGFLAAAAVLGGWLVAGLLRARREPVLFLSVAAFLGFSFITSNVPFAIGTVFGERLFYMPSLGVSLLVIVLAERLGPRGRRVLVAALALWSAACAVVIVQRNSAWRDSETLFVGDAARLPASADLQAKAGYMLLGKDPERALALFRASVAREPEIAASWATLGRIHAGRGELERAEECYARALATRYVAYSGVEDRTIEDYLGVLARRGERAELLAFARRTLARKPGHLGARLALLDHGRELLAPRERHRVLADGLARAPHSVPLVLREAMFRYEHGQDDAATNRHIAERLGWALAAVPPHERDSALHVRARLYLGDALGRIGERRRALAVFEGLLDVPGLGGEARKRVRAEVRRLRR